jgi:hypothetical protein
MRLIRPGSTLAGLLVVTPVILAMATVPAFAQDRDSGGEQGMLEAINARRAAQGLAPLSREARLDAAAVRHSAEMAEHDVLEHVSEGSGTPADRVQAAGLTIDEIAENVAMHNDTASAQQALEQSEPHLANMLNPRFTHVGLASVRDERGIYITQVYGRVESAPEAAPAPPPQILAPESAVQPAPAAPVSGGAHVLVPGPTSRPVVGYWVCAENRWWYYPMPAGAQPGQQLQADTSVTGGPPGYDPTQCVAGQMVQPTEPPPRVFQPAPPPPQVYQVTPPPRAYYPPVYQPPPPAVYYPPPPPPRVYYPPPRRGSRYIVVQPPPGRMIVPYAPHYRGGVQVEVGPRPRVRVWRR